MKYPITLLIFSLFLLSCSTSQKSTSSSDGMESSSAQSVEDIEMSIDLTTYLKRFAGIYVSGNGYNATISVRGVNSLSPSRSEPLVIIDGNQVASYSEAYSMVNSAMIKRIQVLKNPDEIGIYGVRGANGVIKITTKKS